MVSFRWSGAVVLHGADAVTPGRREGVGVAGGFFHHDEVGVGDFHVVNGASLCCVLNDDCAVAQNLSDVLSRARCGVARHCGLIHARSGSLGGNRISRSSGGGEGLFAGLDCLLTHSSGACLVNMRRGTVEDERYAKAGSFKPPFVWFPQVCGPRQTLVSSAFGRWVVPTQLGPKGDMSCRGVLSVVGKTPEMHIPPWLWFSSPTSLN